MTYTPEKVAELCEQFLREWPRAENGPAHVVLGDWNFETEFIQNCLVSINARLKLVHNGWSLDQPADALNATAAFLCRLLDIPEAERVFPDPEIVME